MVSNPFGGSNSIEVQLQGDGSQLDSAISGAEQNLLSFKGAVGGAGAALGALAVGGLAKSASAAADFEQAMADVEKVTDSQTAEELHEPIQDMAEELPLAAEEISALAAQAGRFGAEGTEEIKDFTQTAAEMGAATTLSADEAGRSLAKVATALGEPLENVDQLGDSINELSNNFATNSDEIVNAAQRGGFAVQEMGLSSDETLGLASALNEVYPSARRAGNAMRQVGEAMTDPDNVASFAEAIGVTEDEFRSMREERPDETLLAVTEAMEQSDEVSQNLSSQLSKQQVRALERVGQQSEAVTEAMGMSNEAMEEGGSLAREVAVETDTFQGQMELLRSQINNVFREIGKNLLPVLTDLMSGVSEAVDGFSSLNDETDGTAGTITLIGAAIAGLGATLAFFIGGPVTLAIGAIALLAAAWTAGWEDTKAAISDGVAFATDALEKIGGWIKENGPGLVQDAIDVFQNMVRDAASWISENAPDLVSEAFQMVGEAIRFVALDIYNGITGNDDSILKSIIVDFGSWLVNEGPGILKSAIGTALDVIWSAFEGLYQGLIGNSLIPDMFGDIATYISDTAPEKLKNAAKSAFGALKDAALNPVETLEERIEEIIGGIKDTIDSVMGGIDDAKESVGNVGGGDSGGVIDDTKSFVSDTIPGLDSGGFIERGGLAQLHAGEQVVPAAQVDRGGGGGGTQQVEVVDMNGEIQLNDGHVLRLTDMAIEQRERRTQRNSGSNLNPR